jgi:hypothetical protein
MLVAVPSVRADTLFLSVPDLVHNIQVTKVDVKYTVVDKANGIGKFSAVGTPTSYAGVSNNISNGAYRIEAFFNLSNGSLRSNDVNHVNLVDVTGTLANVSQTFFHSTTLLKFGWGANDTFDVLFDGNTGTVVPNHHVASRIAAVSIPTYNNLSDPAGNIPKFDYASLLTNSSINNGYVIWDNTPLASGIEKGTANVWAPMPSAASGGFVLLAGLGAHSTFRRKRLV